MSDLWYEEDLAAHKAAVAAMNAPIQITDASGYITDRAVRELYEHILKRNSCLTGGRAAEAFLRLVERYAARGIRLIPERS